MHYNIWISVNKFIVHVPFNQEIVINTLLTYELNLMKSDNMRLFFITNQDITCEHIETIISKIKEMKLVYYYVEKDF